MRRASIIEQSWRTVRLQKRVASKLDNIKTFFTVSMNAPQTVSIDINHVCSVLISLVRTTLRSHV